MVDLEPIRRLVRDEHAWLAGRLGLGSIDLIVFDPDDAGPLPHGIPEGSTDAGYKPGVIFISTGAHNVEEARSFVAERPPTSWAKPVWPAWRIDLWHEVCHQYQDEILGEWDLNDGARGHARGWRSAIDAVAAATGTTGSALLAIVAR